MSDKPYRIQPGLTLDTVDFWTAGADGELRFLHCNDCDTIIHPPQPICPQCLRKNLQPRAVSGRATLHSFTINRHTWIPGFEPPYVIGLIELLEDPRVRLMTNVVNCAIDEVEIGMALEVVFEEQDDGVVFIPLFQPLAADSESIEVTLNETRGGGL